MQHIYQQRWRGSNGLAPKTEWKKRLIGRCLMPAYALAATLYPPLDVTPYVSQSIHRHIVPSPRLKFAIHAIADLSLSCALVLIHGMCGSMESLLRPEKRLLIPWGVRGAFVWYR